MDLTSTNTTRWLTMHILDTPLNIKIGKKAPKEYLNEALNAIKDAQDTSFKAIKSEAEFYQNLEDNCIPIEILKMDYTNYQTFLEARRTKMTALIKKILRVSVNPIIISTFQNTTGRKGIPENSCLKM